MNLTKTKKNSFQDHEIVLCTHLSHVRSVKISSKICFDTSRLNPIQTLKRNCYELISSITMATL